MPEIGGRLLGSALVADPYPFLARLRREAPVWRVPGSEAFFVSTWELVAEAVARVGEFSNHFRHVVFTEDDGAIGVLALPEGGAPDVFAGADPPDHTVHRKVFFPGLVEKRMAALEGHVAALADELVDDLLAAEQGDLASMLANPLPLRVMAERVIGFRDVDVAELQRWVFAGSRYMSGRLRLDDMSQAATDAAPMLPWITAQLDEALTTPSTGDVLSAAAAGVRKGVLTRDEAAFTLTVLLGAGSETTTSLIGNAVRILAERPALQEDLRTGLERIPALVEEVLRYETPFRFHPRSASRATVLGGVEIPEGALLVLLWSSANRDEAVFDRPDEVVLDRPNERMHFGFGRGIHHCVGAPLARLEARIVLDRLLRRTASFALEPGDRPQWVDSLWVRRHDRLPVVMASR
jgi:cytochrome P450 family 144